jgi:hypothetical protein
MKTYRAAPMDGITLGVTISALALFLIITISMLIPFHHAWPTLVISGSLILLVVLCWQVKAERYEIRDDTIVIVRGWPFSDIVIPLSEVREVRPFKFTLRTIRTFGVGGLFSSTGFFWNKEAGKFFASVTNLKCAVLIDGKDKIVISPENPDEFAECLMGAVENTARTAG